MDLVVLVLLKLSFVVNVCLIVQGHYSRGTSVLQCLMFMVRQIRERAGRHFLPIFQLRLPYQSPFLKTIIHFFSNSSGKNYTLLLFYSKSYSDSDYFNVTVFYFSLGIMKNE